MKPSELPKNKITSIRINDQIKKQLLDEGITPQQIIDQFIDAKFEVEKRMVKK